PPRPGCLALCRGGRALAYREPAPARPVAGPVRLDRPEATAAEGGLVAQAVGAGRGRRGAGRGLVSEARAPHDRRRRAGLAVALVLGLGLAVAPQAARPAVAADPLRV